MPIKKVDYFTCGLQGQGNSCIADEYWRVMR